MVLFELKIKPFPNCKSTFAIKKRNKEPNIIGYRYGPRSGSFNDPKKAFQDRYIKSEKFTT